MASQLSAEFINKAIAETTWDLANQVLYDLCRVHPDHTRSDAIIAKVLLIGRTYAAAIERRRNRGEAVGDDFYTKKVAPLIQESDIDHWFRLLTASPKDDVDSILETHFKVTELFTKISEMEKRSLASKYLHFHFPERFYIFDSRAQGAVSSLASPIGKALPKVGKHDNVYARFFFRCHTLRRQFESAVDRQLTPREFDKVLLAYRADS